MRYLFGLMRVFAKVSPRVPRLLFWALFTPLLISSSGIVCITATGDTRLASLGIEVLGENRIAFDPALRVYDVGIPVGATTMTVRAQAMDAEATVTWYVPDGTGVVDSGIIGVGGGAVTVDLPPDGYSLYVGVFPPGGAVDTYIATFTPCSSDCSDDNDCTADVCDPANGACSNPEEADGVACDFGGGMCASGTCELQGFVAGPPVTVSGLSPFAECSADFDLPLVFSPNSEVETWIAVNPTNPDHMAATWQQDRYSTGGCRGNVAGISFDGGASWEMVVIPGLSPCSGGTWDGASDPWLAFAANGDLYSASLTHSDDHPEPGINRGIVVHKSLDGGLTWSEPTTLGRTEQPMVSDKETITADPFDACSLDGLQRCRCRCRFDV